MFLGKPSISAEEMASIRQVLPIPLRPMRPYLQPWTKRRSVSSIKWFPPTIMLTGKLMSFLKHLPLLWRTVGGGTLSFFELNSANFLFMSSSSAASFLALDFSREDILPLAGALSAFFCSLMASRSATRPLH